ncbi:hypothetical protein GCM10009742_60760 [Kribbella karoonensis]|uniref:Uncharacterized protein n=1 Tax=Kribbella karoonensis TaxID=324851 RepID=A0ABN2EEK2_9ACTN
MRYHHRTLLTYVDPEPLRQARYAFEQQSVHLCPAPPTTAPSNRFVNPMGIGGPSAGNGVSLSNRGSTG